MPTSDGNDCCHSLHPAQVKYQWQHGLTIGSRTTAQYRYVGQNRPMRCKCLLNRVTGLTLLRCNMPRMGASNHVVCTDASASWLFGLRQLAGCIHSATTTHSSIFSVARPLAWSPSPAQNHRPRSATSATANAGRGLTLKPRWAIL